MIPAQHATGHQEASGSETSSQLQNTTRCRTARSSGVRGWDTSAAAGHHIKDCRRRDKSHVSGKIKGAWTRDGPRPANDELISEPPQDNPILGES